MRGPCRPMLPVVGELTPAQRQAVTHTGGAVVVVGSAGTGKTATLAARFHRIVEDGEPPERILFLAPSAAAADNLRARLESGLAGAWEELAVLTFPALCEKLLADGGLQAGLDPFAVALTPADRLAMLLERVDELTLRAHDLGGDAAALLGSFVRRIDRLKEAGVTVEEHAAWAAGLPGDDDSARVRARLAREFATVWEAHERMLAEAGALDAGDLVLRAIRLLREAPHVRRRVAEAWRHVLADDVPDLSFAQGLLLRLLATEHGQLAVAGDPDQAVQRMRGAATKNLDDVRAEFPDALEVHLDVSQRCPGAVLRASRAIVDRDAVPVPSFRSEGAAELWRCANERAQAQAVAGDVERLVAREGVDPARIAVLVRSVDREGPAVGVALAERDVPHRLLGAAAFFQRAEIRDVLAWLRLLKDSGDAGAVVRALARPPIELRSVDLARCTQIARRRKLDMVAGLVAATESPQIPPEARERILLFLKTYRALAGAFETARPDLYVHRLIDRLGLRRPLVFSADPDVGERLRDLPRLAEIAAAHVRRDPHATARDFAAYVAAVAEAAGPDDEAGMGGSASEDALAVLSMAAAKGLEWDHVYVVGLHAARLPGAREVTEEAVPDALLHETLPPDGREAHLGTMRRLLNLAVTRARERVVLAYPQSSERGAAQIPSPFLENVREALGAPDYEDRSEELFGPDETLHATFRALRNELLEGVQRTGYRLG